MTKLTHLFATAAFAGVLGLIGLPAASASVIWTSEYNGDELPNQSPSDPIWSNFSFGPDYSASVSGGILNITAGSTSSGQGYLLTGGTGLAWDPTELGSTLEIRMKINSVAGGAVFSQKLGILTSTTSFSIAWNEVLVSELYSSALSVLDTTEYHVYRFTIEDTNSLSIYIDGNEVPVMSGITGAANSGGPLLGFGALGGGIEAGDVSWDYIRWTNAGAFAPIPEPASLVLFGLAAGGLFLCRKSKAKN